jgi:histidinol-phosphatase
VPPQRDDTATLQRFAHAILDETDAIALRHVANGLDVTTKPDRTLVTQMDTEIETHLRDRIGDAYPKHTVLGEEFGTEPDAGDGRWIIDPVDATHNVVRGIEVFATLLAFERDGTLELGVVSAPAMRRRWFAQRDAGAHLRADGRERPIRVSQVDEMANAQVVFSTLRGLSDAGLGDALHRLTSTAWRDRGFGDFWGHMLVAQGSAEMMIEYGVKPWDMAAPYVIVTEAGGRMTDHAGNDSWTVPQVLTSNGHLHGRLLELLGEPPA